MKDRFDLETDIMNCWSVVEDIKTVYRYHLDKKELTEDELANILIGLEKLYQIKFEMLWDTFETLVSNRQFDNERPARAAVFSNGLGEVNNEQSTSRKNKVRYDAGDYELGN